MMLKIQRCIIEINYILKYIQIENPVIVFHNITFFTDIVFSVYPLIYIIIFL